jgi:ABC-type nickel/cobalt efflux system permease component RcnA
VRALRGGQPGAWSALLAVCFGYGVLHAAGPGHGKLVIGSYGMAQRVRLVPLAGVALLASLAQAAVAVGLVGAGVLVLGWTRDRLEGVAEDVLAPAGTIAIAGVGLWLIWGGVRAMRRRSAQRLPHDHDHHDHEHHDHDHAPGGVCTHAHGPTLSDMNRMTSGRDVALLIAGIALRPCSGALFLLILCFGLGIGAAGVAGTFAMGLGTACVTVAVAVLAVWAREGVFASLPGAGSGRWIAAALPMVQALAGALVVSVSLSLLWQGL